MKLGKRITIILTVVLSCLALLCCTGIAYFAYASYRLNAEKPAMEAAGRAVCQDLLTGNAAGVYAALSDEARGRYSSQALADALADALNARGRITDCVVVRAVYLLFLEAYVEIRTGDGEHTLDLIWEAGKWLVESDILHDLDSPSRHSGGGGGFGD